MKALKRFKFFFLILILNCSQQEIKISTKQISILHRATNGIVNVVHIANDTIFQVNSLYADSVQIRKKVPSIVWEKIIADLNQLNLLSWPESESEWSNRPEEFEISIYQKNQVFYRRINNGLKVKFDAIKSIYCTSLTE